MILDNYFDKLANAWRVLNENFPIEKIFIHSFDSIHQMCVNTLQKF